MPYHDALDDALEFDVLVRRAARRGRLDIGDLQETFASMAHSFAPELAAQNALDLESLAEALGFLPPGWAEASSVWLVADLDAFAQICHEPQGAWPWARVAEGPLLIACPRGLADVQSFAYALCVVAHEGHKWRRLLKAHGPLASAPGDAGHALEAALVAGVDADAWRRVDALATGLLWAHLMRETQPSVVVHATLHPRQTHALAERAVPQMLAAVAESGFADRPVHLWIGPSELTDALSPYPRDLGPRLLAWAEGHTQPGAPLEDAQDALYRAMHQFLASDPQLFEEACTQERTAGVQRLFAGPVPFDLVDLRRVDAALCDPMLRHVPPGPEHAPIILRLNAPMQGATAPVVAGLVHALCAQLASVTVIAEGAWSWAALQTVAPLRTHQPWQPGFAGPFARAMPEALPHHLSQAAWPMAPIDTFVDVPWPRASCPKSLVAHLSSGASGVTFGLLPLTHSISRSLMKRPAHLPQVPVTGLVFTPQRFAQGASVRLSCAVLDALSAPEPKPADQAPSAAKTARRSATRLRV